jgi:hypothetical protein
LGIAAVLGQDGGSATLLFPGTGLETFSNYGVEAGTAEADHFMFGDGYGGGTPVDGYIDNILYWNCPGSVTPTADLRLAETKPDSGGHLRLAPNPAHNEALAAVPVPVAGNVQLTVYDLTGGKVLREELGFQMSGTTTRRLPLANLASGIYLLDEEEDSGQGWHSLQRFKFVVIH